MLKHVLIPLDGSLLSRTALQVAVHSLDTHCSITLLTAVAVPEMPIYGDAPIINFEPDASATLEALRENASAYLRGAAERLRAQGYTVTTLVETGEPAQTIIRVADEYNVDMMIMSTHGRTGLTRWMFGSVTNRVLSMTSRPVLVIPNKLDQEQRQFESETTELYHG
jgi:nucleotide-binding universal stress UspA family protein